MNVLDDNEEAKFDRSRSNARLKTRGSRLSTDTIFNSQVIIKEIQPSLFLIIIIILPLTRS